MVGNESVGQSRYCTTVAWHCEDCLDILVPAVTATCKVDYIAATILKEANKCRVTYRVHLFHYLYIFYIYIYIYYPVVMATCMLIVGHFCI